MNEKQIRAKIEKLEKLAAKAADKTNGKYEQYMAQIAKLENDLYDITGDID